MNTIKRIYFTSVIVSLAFFAACGDSESTDITTPDDSSETDITDSSNIDKDSSVTGDSSATKDSSSVKDTSSVKSSSSTNGASSSCSGNNPSSSSSGNTTITSSSSINGNETAGGCIVSVDTTAWHLVNKDTVYWLYPISCDGVQLGSLNNEADKNLPIAIGGQSCTLNDHLDGIVDVTCNDTTYTLNKPSNTGGFSFAPEFFSCKDTDLWCHNPHIDEADQGPTGQLTYRKNEGVFFGSAGTHDLTDWEGICITYTSDTVANIILDLGETKNQELNNNLPQATINNKAILPTESCYFWNSFKQPRWGSPAISGKDAAKTVASFKISQPSEGNFNLIRVRTVSEGYNEKRNRPACGDMWCGPEYSTQVSTVTSYEDEYEVGDWQGTTDKTDGGSSTVTWPYKLGNDFNPNAVDDIIYMYESVAGKYTLGSGIENPYVKIGFEIDNMDTRDYDISKWNGICLSYKADYDFALELTSSDKSATNPRVSIPKSYKPTTIDLPWTALTPSDASKVSFINFVFSGAAGTTGYFAFYSVGRLGTCTKQN